MGQNQNDTPAPARKNICVCAIINGKMGAIFEADCALDFLQLACLLREKTKKGDALGREFSEDFGERRYIEREGFDLRAQEFMAGAQHIRGVFSINFEHKKISALDRAEGWIDYKMTDLSVAAYYAYLKKGRSEAERRAVFLDRLQGKVQNHLLHPEAKLTFGLLP